MSDTYVVRINTHNREWDGSICSDPAANDDCRAKLNFKSDYCARGDGRCFFLSAFAPEPELQLTKTQAPYREVFEEQRPSRGDLVLLWSTYADDRDFVTGLWTVDSFAEDDQRFILRGDVDDMARFPLRVVEFAEVKKRVRRTVGADMIRLLASADTRTLLDIFASTLQRERDQRVDARVPVVGLSASLDTIGRVAARLPEPDRGLTQRITIPAGLFATSDVDTAPQEAEDESVADHAGAVAFDVGSEDELVGADADPKLDGYGAATVREYAIALSVAQLVLLAGPSGVGKTNLARAYADATGAHFELVPVRPDWRTNEDLLGYLPPFGGEFVATAFTRFVRQAAVEADDAARAGRPPRQFHMCLDEMNLARPEYYLAEVLSRMELPERSRVLHLYDASTDVGFPRQLALPTNLRIIGTVNNDDTTQPLSPKVMDRAVYLRLDQVDLAGHVARHGGASADLVGAVLPELDAIVADTGHRVGYRSASKICRWVDASIARGIDDLDALDAAINALVLTKLRLQRSARAHLDALDALSTFLEGIDDGTRFTRSLESIDRLRDGLDRSEFAIGQFET